MLKIPVEADTGRRSIDLDPKMQEQKQRGKEEATDVQQEMYMYVDADTGHDWAGLSTIKPCLISASLPHPRPVFDPNFTGSEIRGS